MPIDLVNEQPISIAVARRKYIPRINYGPISPATASRWINKGVLAGDGTRVRLEAVKVGRSLMTTKESVGTSSSDSTNRAPRRSKRSTTWRLCTIS